MKLSNVNSRYGAPMGRSGLTPVVFATRAHGEGAKIHLVHIRLDSGGYDSGGAYWGFGAPLYYAYFEDSEGETNKCFFRASSRETAKKELRAYESELKFYR